MERMSSDVEQVDPPIAHEAPVNDEDRPPPESDPPRFDLQKNQQIDDASEKIDTESTIDTAAMDTSAETVAADQRRYRRPSNASSTYEAGDRGPPRMVDRERPVGLKKPQIRRMSNGSFNQDSERGVLPTKRLQNRRRVSRGSLEKKMSEKERLHNLNPVSRPDGVFLTAPRDQEDVYASRDDDSGFATAREDGSIVTSRDEKGTMTMGDMRGDNESVSMSYNENIGPFGDSDYSRGLHNLRERLKDLESDVEKCKKDFYQSEKPSTESYLKYLDLCNDNFKFCSDVLKKNNIQPRKIDSEVRIVALLNDLRITEDPDVDPEILGFITDFWENLKQTCDCALVLNSKFAGNIYKKLKKSCRSASGFQGVDLNITNQYTKDIVGYMNNLETTMSSLAALTKSFQNGLNSNLFSGTGISQEVTKRVNHAQFPVLRLVPDLTEKLEFICKIAHDWIDRDEAYVEEIKTHILRTRTLRREHEEQIRDTAEQKRKVAKSMKLAYLVCQNNKKKLQRLEKELEKMHRQVREFTAERKAKDGERHAKESMLDFLKISISQTKMNYSLQMRKSRLLRQLKDLEGTLSEIETQMASLQDLISEKTLLREEIAIRLEENGGVYLDMKKELQDFTENLQHLYQGLAQLQETMSQLEFLQNIKTSPEKIDDFYDRPSSVKLAPSLKEKIRRKRRIQAGTIVVSTARSTLPRLISEEDRDHD
ncbi:uncharacterized protein LOC135493832 [Lineus longissimus]|uniref:uncharacterized protein LOC135493832 n=1 Tax=Lineus longissimus TaxID=88925 RepID=UPI00315CDD7A